MKTETQQTHTPGPWRVRALSYGLGVFKEEGNSRILIAQVQETAAKVDEPEHAPFDAALIASAPDLLEALDTAEVWMSEFNEGGIFDRPLKEIRAAIAKAKGQ